MSLNLEKQLQFYGSYHHDPVNVGIHMVFVPILLFTGLLFATNSPDLAVPAWMDIPNLPINLGTIAAVLYALLYILMEPVAGALCAPLIIGGVAVANYLTHTYGMIATSIALGVHVFSWIIQFVGHGKFEGRAPALLDNLVQALFLAPFFVWFELLFWVGYRPELKARLEKSIQQNIREFKLSKDKAGLNGSADDKAS